MKRRTFVGLTATAAAMGATGTIPRVATQRVTLTAGNSTVPAYAAAPQETNEKTPGVVVVMHVWGVDASIRDVVDELAENGYVAIAPDLYPADAPSGDNATDFAPFRAYAQKLDNVGVDAKLRAGALWLKAAHPQGKVGITGFCMGGAIALRQLIDNAGLFDAAAIWYGRVEGIDPARITVPVLGSYGADDQSIPADDVRKFSSALRVPNDFEIYPGAGHAFFDSHRKSYVASAATDGWRRLLSFFAKYL